MDAADNACTFRQVFEPDLMNTKKYDLIYELYKKVRIHNQEIWDYRHQMNKKIKVISEEE